MLIFDSCTITYSFIKSQKILKSYDTTLWYLLVVILILLFLLAIKEFASKMEKIEDGSTNGSHDMIEKNEATNDNIEDFCEARREERTLKPRPSFMKNGRTRSRSRRR